MMAEKIQKMYATGKLDYDETMRALAVVYHDTSDRNTRAAITKIATAIEREEEAKATA